MPVRRTGAYRHKKALVTTEVMNISNVVGVFADTWSDVTEFLHGSNSLENLSDAYQAKTRAKRIAHALISKRSVACRAYALACIYNNIHLLEVMHRNCLALHLEALRSTRVEKSVDDLREDNYHVHGRLFQSTRR